MVAEFTSPNARQLQTSLIRKLANQAMGREEIIPLWFGEPDVVTPDFIRTAAKQAIDAGEIFYQPNMGSAPYGRRS